MNAVQWRALQPNRPAYYNPGLNGCSAHDSGALLGWGDLFAENRPRDVRTELFAQHGLPSRAGGLLNGGAMLGRQSPIGVQPRPDMPAIGVAED